MHKIINSNRVGALLLNASVYYRVEWGRGNFANFMAESHARARAEKASVDHGSALIGEYHRTAGHHRLDSITKYVGGRAESPVTPKRPLKRGPGQLVTPAESVEPKLEEEPKPARKKLSRSWGRDD